MPKRHSPRKGSLQVWPRKRARRQYAKIRSWVSKKDTKLLGFGGYKAGMTHVMINDTSTALTKGETITVPVTIIECPPLKVFSIRFYKNTNNGKIIVGELFSDKINKEVKRKTGISKKSKDSKDYDDIKVVVYTQPKLTKIKKKPEIFELAISGDKEKGLGFAKQLLDREINIRDVFKEGQFIDVHSVTKGKGFQGTVKRYGVDIRQHKSEKTKRGIGTLGPFTPRKVNWRVPQPGKMGYHLRTEYNKWNMKIGRGDINMKGGFLGYGLVNNDYLMLKGSIAGARKRLVIMTEPLRERKPLQPDLKYISLESKQ